MSIFSKKKEEGCCCEKSNVEVKNIKVLGLGCKSCHQMLENTQQAVKELNLNVEVEYITELEKIMAYGAMSMPGLVINDKLVSVGKVLKCDEVKKYIG